MRALLIALAAALALAGCARDSGGWHAKNITGLMPDLRLAMTDDHGRAVSAADYRGETVLLFFGYTHCPDTCPTTLAKLAQAIRAMPDRGQDVRVLFVTVDPARDTPERLVEYMHAFGERFVGLRGTDDELRSLSKRYRVSYTPGKPETSGEYEVSHSSGVFVFDRDGRARLLILEQDPGAGITADLERLAAEARKAAS